MQNGSKYQVNVQVYDAKGQQYLEVVSFHEAGAFGHTTCPIMHPCQIQGRDSTAPNKFGATKRDNSMCMAACVQGKRYRKCWISDRSISGWHEACEHLIRSALMSMKHVMRSAQPTRFNTFYRLPLQQVPTGCKCIQHGVHGTDTSPGTYSALPTLGFTRNHPFCTHRFDTS